MSPAIFSGTTKRCFWVPAIFLLFGLSSLAAQGLEKSDWAPLEFLMGYWTAKGSGQPGEAVSGFTSFAFELDKHILFRRSRAEYAAKPGDTKGLVHEDLMTIYRLPGDQRFHAIYFDNEGHVISYLLSFPSKQPAVIFESIAVDGQPRFRLVYELQKEGEIMIDFQIAPSGGDFKSYVKGTAQRSFLQK